MTEYFRNQPSLTLFNAATLTAAASGNRKTFSTGGFGKLSLDFDYTMGAAEVDGLVGFGAVLRISGAVTVV